MTYEELENIVLRITEDGLSSGFPKDIGNKDYLEYLEWKEAQK